MKKRVELLKELRSTGRAELIERSGEKAQEMMNLRFKGVVGGREQSHRLGLLRRERARILTVVSEMARAGSGSA